MSDLISRQAAIDAVNDITKWYCKTYHETRPTAIAVIDALQQLPPAQPEPCLDLIVSEIEETIRETKESGKHHDINVRANGDLICYGLQLALEIIEEKRNERFDIQAIGD